MMADCEEETLREWAPLAKLLQKIPPRIQRGLFANPLSLTCVDALPEFLAVGTNAGLVYWYDRVNEELQLLRCENSMASVTCVRAISTVDFMVAAGDSSGAVTIFQIPKVTPDSLPESLRINKNRKVERYTISGLHKAPVSAVEWSLNGMKLFSGDRFGLVVHTEIDFYLHISKSSELLDEKYEIVQLVYRHQLLLVSTVYRSIICHREQERWKVNQIGQKERKCLGRHGATFISSTSVRSDQIRIAASRPGLRIWIADRTGLVLHTLMYRDAVASSPKVSNQLLNPRSSPLISSSTSPVQFGLLHFWGDSLVTYDSDVLFVLDIRKVNVTCCLRELRAILDISIGGARGELFILEGARSLIRIAFYPEPMQVDPTLVLSPTGSTFRELTERLKDSALGVAPASAASPEPAYEALELPPVVPLELAESASSTPQRVQLLDKIGEQQFEDVLYKHEKPGKSNRKRRQRQRDPLNDPNSEESGSDSTSSSFIGVGSDSCDTLVQSVMTASIASDECTSIITSSISESWVPRMSLDLSLQNTTGSNGPPYKADLRSPSVIEKEVQNKERLLAKLLDLDSLCSPKIPELEDEASTPMLAAVEEDLPIDSAQTPLANGGLMESIQLDKNETECSPLDYTPTLESSDSLKSQPSLETPSSSVHLPVGGLGGEQTDRWIQYKTPYNVVSISACEKYLCCVDSKDAVFYATLGGLTLAWQRVDYSARQLAVSPTGMRVWKIATNIAYCLHRPAIKGPFGPQWTKKIQDAQSLSVTETSVWVVTSDARLWLFRSEEAEKPIPVPCQLPIISVSATTNTVWILTGQSTVFALREPNRCERPQWTKIPTPGLVVTIALDAAKRGWIVDAKSASIYFTPNYLEKNFVWWQIYIGECLYQHVTPLQQFCSKLADQLRPSPAFLLAPGRETIVLTEKHSQHVYLNCSSFTGHQWIPTQAQVHFKACQISAEGVFEDKGQIWLLSQEGYLFASPIQLDNFHSLPMPEGKKPICLAASPQALWLLMNNGQVYLRQGISDTCLDGSFWRTLSMAQLGSLRLTHISCGLDVVWACAAENGAVYAAVGSPYALSTAPSSPAWIEVDDISDVGNSSSSRRLELCKVFAGPQPSMVWALNSKGNIYVREGIFPNNPLGTSWVLVSGIDANHLTISSSAVWALSSKGAIYRRHGITENNYIGDFWSRIPGCGCFLTASVNDKLWALEKSSNNEVRLLEHLTLDIILNETTKRQRTAPTNHEDTDWELV